MVGSGGFWWVGNGSHGAGRKGDKGTNTHQGSGPDKQVAGSHDTELLVKTINGDFEFDHHGFAVLYRFTDSHGAMFGQIRVPGDALALYGTAGHFTCTR